MDAKDNDVLPETLATLTDTDTDYTFVLIPYWAKLLASSDETEKVIELRYEAMKSLTSRLASYKSHGYIEKLLCAIARKKADMIMRTSTKTEMEKVMKIRPPYFDGVKFIVDEYSVPEEEMILWSETSFKAPLRYEGVKRYKELFEQIFPEQAEKIFRGI